MARLCALRTILYTFFCFLFAFPTTTVLHEIRQHLPDVGTEFQRYQGAVGTPDEARYLAESYDRVRPISIDYGVMEKTQLGCVVPADIGWDDVGNWDSFSKYMDKDQMGNSVKGTHVGIDSRNCVVYSENQVVATAGLRDMMIVATDDALLVVPRGKGEEVKRLVSLLEEKGLHNLL